MGGTGWIGATVSVVLMSLFTLPIAILGLALTLGSAHNKRYGVWLLGAAALVVASTFMLMFAMVRSSGAPATDALFVSLAALPFFLGFIVALLGTLLVFRLCGFRLYVLRSYHALVPSTPQ